MWRRLDKRVEEKPVEITKTILWKFSVYFHLTIQSAARKALKSSLQLETFGFIWKFGINRVTSRHASSGMTLVQLPERESNSGAHLQNELPLRCDVPQFP
jgi:hypothetical protein